jgi:hypothetical protein
MKDLFAALELEKKETQFDMELYFCENENIENLHLSSLLSFPLSDTILTDF